MLRTKLSGIEQLERKELFASLLGETAETDAPFTDPADTEPTLGIVATQDADASGLTTFYALRNGSDTAAATNQLWGDWFIIDEGRAIGDR